jgi:hypothetical protein
MPVPSTVQLQLLVGLGILLVGTAAFAAAGQLQPLVAATLLAAAIGALLSRVSVGCTIVRASALAAPALIDRLLLDLGLDPAADVLDVHAASTVVRARQGITSRSCTELGAEFVGGSCSSRSGESRAAR